MSENRAFIVDGWMADSESGRLHLTGQRCENCATCLWPPAAHCKACGSATMIDVEFGPEAELWSVTIDRVGTYLGRPNVVGQVRFPEGVFAQGYIAGDVDAPPAIGSRMELVPFEVPSGDGPVVTYAFRVMEV